MFRFVSTSLLGCLFTAGLWSAEGRILLDWDDNTEADLAGYQVYRSLSSPVAVTDANKVGGVLSQSQYLDTGLGIDTTYFYVVTAIDQNGNESGPSGEASATTRGPSGSGPVHEPSGETVAIDAGDFRRAVAGTGPYSGHAWQDQADASAAGGTALQALPNIGANTVEELTGPRLDYDIDFAAAGQYYIWLRLRGESSGDDSVHVGLDGSAISLGGLGVTAIEQGWQWVTHVATRPPDIFPRQLTIDIPAPGRHTINVWMREDGVWFDRLYLSKDAAGPSGEGPASSPQQDDGLTSTLAINVGGGDMIAADGTSYSADVGATGGSTFASSAPIAGTTDDALYQSLRWGDFSYASAVANGDYVLTLHFAEVYWHRADRRVFAVAVEGQNAISALDLIQTVGRQHAYAVHVPVTISDGELNISCTGSIDQACLSAIHLRAVPNAVTKQQATGAVRPLAIALPSLP